LVLPPLAVDWARLSGMIFVVFDPGVKAESRRKIAL